MSFFNHRHGKRFLLTLLLITLLTALIPLSTAQGATPSGQSVNPPFPPPGLSVAPPDSPPGQEVKRLHQLDDARVAPEDALRAPAAAPPASGDYRINSLLSPYRWPAGTAITYSFYEDDVFHGSYYGSERGVQEVSEPVKENVRKIMAWYQTLLNVTITQVIESQDNIGLIRFMLSEDPQYAYAYYPSSTAMFALAGDIHLKSSYDRLVDTNGFQQPAGKHGFASLIHEIGHTLGLKHPFDGSPRLPAAEDNDSHTIMTYTWHGSSPGTPMVYDLLALHHLYGARPKNSDGESYAFTSWGPDRYTLGESLYFSTPYTTRQTIWDSAGTDTLDFSALPYNSGGYRLDLKGGGWLSATSQYYGDHFNVGTAIASPFDIEKVVNSSSSDTIYANPAANVFGGYTNGRSVGQDVIYDAVQADTVDLSTYPESGVTRDQSGTDLILTLGTNGSITLKNYYAGNTPAILYQGQTANQPPVARITAGPTSGNAPLTVSFDGTASSDPGGTINSWIWSFGDGGTGSGSTVSHTYATPGSYTAILTVTDNQGATGSVSVPVVVQQDPNKVIRVNVIDLKVVSVSRSKAVDAQVTITNVDGSPVAGATVTGKWSGLVSGTSTGKTDGTGKVTLRSKTTNKSGTVTFTVTGITPPAGYSYDATQNAENSDSTQVSK